MKYIITERQLQFIQESQEYLNQLLDKINTDGYDSLTNKEKDALIKISKGEEVYNEPNELPVSDDVHDANRMFLHYAGRYQELEVDDLLFRISPLGDKYIEILGDYHNFSIEPNFEENQVIIYNPETDEADPVKYKNVPESTEGMRKLVVKFVFNLLPEYIRHKIQNG